jgi:alpha-1,6-mannosyltransferase
VVVVLEAGWLVGQGHLRGWAVWGATGAVAAAWTALVVAEHRRPALGGRAVLLATAAVALVAVAVPPFGSRDLYEYAMYGRMVVDHHANPYLVPPSRFAGDPLVAHLAPVWRHSRTVYGPVFTAWSALGAVGFGRSALLARLFFQATAAAALVGAVAYLWRRGVPAAALVATGLSPVLVATVNGGHNDLLAGLGALVGIDLVRTRRPVAGGVALALACGVKLSVLPLAAAVGVVLVARRAWPALAGVAVGFVPVALGPYALAGGMAALGPLSGLAHARSRASVWTALVAVAPRVGLPVPTGHEVPQLSVAMVGCLAAMVAVAALLTGRRRRVDPAVLGVTLGVVALFGATYVLPWYPAVVLPLAALCLGSLPARAAHAGAMVLWLAYVVPPGRAAVAVPDLVDAARACGLVLAVLAVAAALSGAFASPAGDGP